MFNGSKNHKQDEETVVQVAPAAQKNYFFQ